MDYRYISSPIGDLLLAGNQNGLCYVGFPTGKGTVEPKSDWQLNNSCFQQAEKQLSEYFAGKRKTFELQLCPHGTDFQLEVLKALQEIPCGETRSYLEIAQRIGRPKAVRAVGAANGRNPLPIVIPCHRVIGADGTLTGFGGGIAAKEYLLRLEGSLRSTPGQKDLF